ncbi:choloylglycine hydrolase, partial [Pseudoalteromonas sp. NEC-BIFX-2020_015]|nr:choloylglycine hydrolase [Pseudoalteromonas sp. NEC-BIFX-2020_015]
MCTDFSIKAINSGVSNSIPVIGRSMELGPDLKSELFFRADGHEYKQSALKKLTQSDFQDDSGLFVLRDDIELINQRLLTWTGSYSFVAMNGFNLDIAKSLGVSETFANIMTNGLNTEGLTTGAM